MDWVPGTGMIGMKKMYATKDGRFYQKSYKHIVIIVILAVFLLYSVFSTVQYNKVRGQLDTAREQLTAATETNKRLTVQLGQCQFIVSDLAESTNRNITNVRECIELLEEIRTQVGSLEMVFDTRSTVELYGWCDDRVGLPEEMR